MDQAGWQRAKDVIADALLQPPSARAAFLKSACPDPALRAEIEAMLATYEETPQNSQNTQKQVFSEPTQNDSAGSASSAVPVFEFSPGYEAGPYTFIEPLGVGGGGEVHRARDGRLQRDVAIKVLPPAPAAAGARRVREARAAAQLNHPGIAAIYDIFDLPGDADRLCIVMEYLAGRSLADWLRDRRPSRAEVAGFGLQIADAVAHAHAAGIVHCDLKPANIRFAADGSIKILDFGLARRSAEASREASGAPTGLTASSLHGLAIGTPGYMSPEQLLGLPIDRRTDVYSLGVILYEMAAGRRPYEAQDLMSTAVAVLASPLPELPRDVPRRLRAVIEKALSRAADARFESAAALGEALRTAAAPRWRNLFGTPTRR